MATDANELQTRTRYAPAEVEPELMRRWLASGSFHPERQGDAEENYSIAIPPPNITGALALGMEDPGRKPAAHQLGFDLSGRVARARLKLVGVGCHALGSLIPVSYT